MFARSLSRLLGAVRPGRRTPQTFRPRLEELEPRIEFATDVVFSPAVVPAVVAVQQQPAFAAAPNLNANVAIRLVQTASLASTGGTDLTGLTGPTLPFLTDPRGIGSPDGAQSRFLATAQFLNSNDILEATDEPVSLTLLMGNLNRGLSSSFIPSIVAPEILTPLFQNLRATLPPSAANPSLQALNPIDALLTRGNPPAGMTLFSIFPVMSAATVRNIGAGNTAPEAAGNERANPMERGPRVAPPALPPAPEKAPVKPPSSRERAPAEGGRPKAPAQRTPPRPGTPAERRTPEQRAPERRKPERREQPKPKAPTDQQAPTPERRETPAREGTERGERPVPARRPGGDEQR